MEDTIVAISTSLGVGAISIIRVSGNEAIEIVNKITKNTIKNQKTHTIKHNYIIENNDIVDEVMISIMKGPKSYTKEDIVEINIHGGIAPTNKILELLIENGCRLANPGEFTKRAFLNGRIDLIEAEGIMDMINSTTEKSLKMAVSQLDGSSSKLIKNLREKLIQIISNIEVNIDYPEYYDINNVTNNDILMQIDDIILEMNNIINNSKDASIIKDGINTVIIGKPNVGKSSLLNMLINQEKAIVTDIPGTTRDIVEGQIYIDGIKLNIIDTAGIRKTDDVIENIGVKKSLKLLNEAQLIILVLNNNEAIMKEELELIKTIKDKNYIIVVNKNDLEKKLKIDDDAIYISALNNEGAEKIKNKIKELFNLEKIDNGDFNYISSSRSIGILKESLNIIKKIKKDIKNQIPIDMIEIDLKIVWNKLGEIIGETYEEELLDELFSRFCLGK